MKNKKQFQQDLVEWFKKNQRILPWRSDKNPYKIWISEVMLQQTKVDTVVPYFQRFIQAFPTVEALANANEQEVLKLWEGLGYYSRARNLHSGAKQIVEEFKGIFPETLKEISTIKGIGPYTAGAILSIAFGKAEPAVDGNVIRVYSRVFSVWDDIAKPKTRNVFEKLVYETIDEKNTSFFNQGIMEIGALICTPTSPKCQICPLSNHCKAFEEGKQAELPVKSKKKKAKTVELSVLVAENEDGNWLIQQRDEKGLLANLWEFPMIEKNEALTDQQAIEIFVKNKWNQEIKVTDSVLQLEHIFTHLKWKLTIYKGTFKGTIPQTEKQKFVSKEELLTYPFPVSHQKIYQQLLISTKCEK